MRARGRKRVGRRHAAAAEVARRNAGHEPGVVIDLAPGRDLLCQIAALRAHICALWGPAHDPGEPDRRELRRELDIARGAHDHLRWVVALPVRLP